MEFFRIKKDIPFMKHALVFNAISILTSIFSSVVVSRGLVNLIYGRQKKLTKVAIGQLWKPGNATVTGKN